MRVKTHDRPLKTRGKVAWDESLGDLGRRDALKRAQANLS